MLSRLLRLPLRFIPQGTVVPILSGPAKGLRWVVGTGTNGCWVGSYERIMQGHLAHSLRPGHVAFDIGANAGFFTILMARLVGPTGQVHAFEPVPENVAILRRHVELNGFTNVTVHPVAVTDKAGMVSFNKGPNHSAGFVGDTGDYQVESVALDHLDLPRPHAIKMDIEGGESLALCGMTGILRSAQPLLLIEGHDRQLR